MSWRSTRRTATGTPPPFGGRMAPARCGGWATVAPIASTRSRRRGRTRLTRRTRRLRWADAVIGAAKDKADAGLSALPSTGRWSMRRCLSGRCEFADCTTHDRGSDTTAVLLKISDTAARELRSAGGRRARQPIMRHARTVRCAGLGRVWGDGAYRSARRCARGFAGAGPRSAPHRHRRTRPGDGADREEGTRRSSRADHQSCRPRGPDPEGAGVGRRFEFLASFGGRLVRGQPKPTR